MAEWEEEEEDVAEREQEEDVADKVDDNEEYKIILYPFLQCSKP